MMSSGVLETKTEFDGREREERHSRVRDSSVKALGGGGSARGHYGDGGKREAV